MARSKLCGLLTLVYVATCQSSSSPSWQSGSSSWFLSSVETAKRQNIEPDALLSKVEDTVTRVKQWTKSQQRILTAVGGATLLLTSKELTYTLLFLQSFRSVGWPLVQQGTRELGQSYTQARLTFRKELPTLMKSRTLLPRLLKDKEDAEKLLAEAAALTRTLQGEAKEAEKKLRHSLAVVEKALPSRRELESIATTATAGLPSKKEVQTAVSTAQRTKASVDRRMAAAQQLSASVGKGDAGSAKEAKSLVASLQREKTEAEAAVAQAKAMGDSFEAAVRAATEQARRALPNAAELKEAVSAAEWAKATVETRLAEGMRLKGVALREYSEVLDTVEEAVKVSNSAQAVAAAVEPEKLERIGRGVVAGVASCVASATSPLAGSALIGVDMGSLIASKAVPAARASKRLLIGRLTNRGVPSPLIKQANRSKWMEAGASAASTAAGVFIAYKARNMALLASGALIGSKMLVGALADQAAAVMSSRPELAGSLSQLARKVATGVDNLDGKEDGAVIGVALPVDGKALAETLVAGLGIALQLRVISFGGLAAPLAVLKAPLAPLLTFEAYLKTVAAASQMKAAGA